MKFFENRKPTSEAIVLLISLLVILTLTIAIVASVSARRSAPVETPIEPDTTTTQSNTSASTEPTTPPTTSDSTDKPTGSDPAPLTLVRPTAGDGKILKSHVTDALTWSPTMHDYRTHAGVDISAAIGSPVYAVADGTIEAVFTDPFLGVSIRIDHGDGIKSCYRNLSDVLPESIVAGKTVIAGEVIAAVGETASEEIAEDAHLHFELMQNNLYLDPADYLTYEVFAPETDFED